MERLKSMSIGTILEWLKGKKTYIMGFVIMIDEIGAAQGLWHANHIREVIEFALTGMAMRAGMK